MPGLRLALIFGGRSGEHEISILSAASCFRAAESCGFETMGIGITRNGSWVYIDDLDDFFSRGHDQVLDSTGKPCYILPDPSRKGIWVEAGPGDVRKIDVDVIFPVLHGPYGEDGTIQGLLEMADIPYVGAPPLASAICMDKSVTKDLLDYYHIPHVPGISISRYAWEKDREGILKDLSAKVTFPLFVKPSGAGSSLGVSKVKAFAQLPAALDDAFLYDTKALLEPSQEGFMEVECSVLGNDEPIASVAGAILPRREFYDYRAKYLDSETRLVIPAPLEGGLMEKVRSIAVKAFKATRCMGMARVDFFVKPETKEVYVNEINTIPGFTAVSMYPKLFEVSGLPYPQLIQTLVNLAIDLKKRSWREVRWIPEKT